MSTLLNAQRKIYQLKADTVRIFSDCDTAELLLENRTRSVLNGVLTNKGNGLTEFRKMLNKLNDSLYSIGGDTLNINAGAVNLYNSNGALSANRIVEGNGKSLQFRNSENFVIANNNQPVIVSRTAMDSSITSLANNPTASPFSGLVVRGTGCDATITLVSDSAGTCSETQAIEFTTLKPRKDSWLTNTPSWITDKFLLGRIQLETSNTIADFAVLKFAIKSDTAFYSDGAYCLYTPGKAGGYTPYPVMSVNPSFRNPVRGYHTRMPYVQVNGGLFVGYGRNLYFNSRNAKDIIEGVDDVPGYLQAFYNTRFSVYADSLPLKIFKLPAIKGTAFLSYQPGRTVDENNVAFEYKDSVYEDIRRYISTHGMAAPADQQMRENIITSQFNTNKLLDLRIQDFSYTNDETKARHTGLLVPELLAVMPELVNGTEGNYNIDYTKMVPYLLKALQEQHQEIMALKQQSVTAAAQVEQQKMPLLPQVQQLQRQLAAQQHLVEHLLENECIVKQ